MIGIIGYGRFGKLAAQYLAQDCEVLVYTRNTSAVGSGDRRIRSSALKSVCRQPYVIPTVPISALKEVLQTISPLLAPDTVVVDVCSVKHYPVAWMKELLPEAVSILATHPMFGPDSAATSLDGMKIALCQVRIADEPYEKIKSYLRSKGLVLIETTPERHDQQIAVSLALTHFIGRSLSAFGAQALEIDTEGYKRLLHILGVVEHDTWQLFEDMHRYNPYAQQARSRFMAAMQGIDKQLNK